MAAADEKTREERIRDGDAAGVLREMIAETYPLIIRPSTGHTVACRVNRNDPAATLRDFNVIIASIEETMLEDQTGMWTLAAVDADVANSEIFVSLRHHSL